MPFRNFISQYFCVFFNFFIISHFNTNGGNIFERKPGYYLAGFVIRSLKVASEIECCWSCLSEKNCVSVNYHTNDGLCELNSGIITESTGTMVGKDDSNLYFEIVKKMCTDKSEFFSRATKRCELFESCKELHENDASLPNGAYRLRKNGSQEEYEVYCKMEEITGCGGGPWTLVMKMDGNKADFNYESSHWATKTEHAREDGLEGLTEKQTKLASYWNTPFEKICLGMKVNDDVRWVVIHHKASSLYNVISGGAYVATTAGRETWKSLIAGSSLHFNCNREGFNMNSHNVRVRVRIGILGNEQNHCYTSDSYIGYGVTFSECGISGITTGNVETWIGGSCSNPKIVSAFGYILVK